MAFFLRRRLAHRRNVGANSPLYDARPDVLYLRCFHTDAFNPYLGILRLTTDEVQLAKAVRPFGDLIAVGRPGEHLPTPGAARMYLTQEEWQDSVCQRMRVAPLVIIRAGQGEGLLWECEQAFGMLSPPQLVILILDVHADEYRHFATAIRLRLGVVLPPTPRCLVLRFSLKPGFILFSEGWGAQFVPIRHWGSPVKAFQKALRPVFAAQGLSER
jgi:hypothetical protein